MQVKFTVNITDVIDADGNTIPTEDEHYTQFTEAFQAEMQDVTHEVFLTNGITIQYEMEDADSICVACETFPCKCE